MPDMPAERLAELWTRHSSTLRASRNRIDACARMRRREVKPTLPPGWKDNPDSFRIMLPQATTMGAEIANFLARKRPAAKRSGAVAPRAQRTASKVEVFIQEALDNKVRVNGGEDLWDTLLANGVNNGEYGVVVTPRPAHWKGLSDFTEEDGQIRHEWRRDRNGRAADDDYYAGDDAEAFEVDEAKSADAWVEHQRMAKLRAWPIVVRVLHPSMCVPIGHDPQTGRVDGLLIRSQRTLLSLKREGFSCLYGAEVAEGAYDGADTSVTFYELHLPGKILYEVDGLTGERYTTRMRDGDAWREAVVDMEADYGVTDVMGGYFYGAHFPDEPDPNLKGYPFIWVYLELLHGINQLSTTQSAYAYRYGFAGQRVEMDKDLLSSWKQFDYPMNFDEQPMETRIMPGKVVSAMSQGTGPDVTRLMGFMTGMLAETGSTEDLKGNAAAGGFGQSVALAAAESTMMHQIMSGATSAWKLIAECTLEIATCLARKTGGPVPLYVTVTPEKRKDKRYESFREQAHVELGADDCAGDFTVDVTHPVRKFDNLAKAQAGAAWVQQGLIGQYEWREEFAGDEQPEDAMDAKSVEQMLDSEKGVAYTWELVATMRGDAEMKKIMALQEQGAVSPGGFPAEMVPPRPGGGDATQGGMPMPNSGNPAQSAVAGIVGGQSMVGPQSRVIQATGQPAEVASI